MSLWSLFYDNDNKKVFKWTHYLSAYEHHFARFVGQPVTILEIGCMNGGSLQMWKRYLGAQATVVSIDINADLKRHEEDRVHLRIGDQSDKAFLQTVVDEFGPFDIVVDDGSHLSPHQIASFEFLYQHTKENGVYVVEDLHANYWPEWGGGVKLPGTFMELAKELVDSLNAYHTRSALPVTEFTNSTMSMHFYDSMLFFEKGRMLRRMAMAVGAGADGKREREELLSIPYEPTR